MIEHALDVRVPSQMSLFEAGSEPACYPHAPGFKTFGASAEAAAAIGPVASVLRARVLGVLRQHEAGMTPDEIAAALNLSPLAIRPRCTELKSVGEIKATGLRRKNSSGLSASVLAAVHRLPMVGDRLKNVVSR